MKKSLTIACALFALAYAGSSKGDESDDPQPEAPTTASPEEPTVTTASQDEPTKTTKDNENSDDIVLYATDCGSDKTKKNYLSKVENKLKKLMPKGIAYRDLTISMRAQAFCMLHQKEGKDAFLEKIDSNPAWARWKYQNLKKEGEGAIPLGFKFESQTAEFFSDLADALNDSKVFNKKYLKDKRNFKLYMAGVNAKGTKEDPAENGKADDVEFWDANSPIEVLIEIPNLTYISPPQGESFAADGRISDGHKHLMKVEWSSANTIQAFELDDFLKKWEASRGKGGLGRDIHIQLLKKKYSETYHAGGFDRAFVYDAKTDKYTHKWN